MRQEISITGKWLFIGAERFDGRGWQPAYYVEGMTWEFCPQYFSRSRTIGNIVEISPINIYTEATYTEFIGERLLKIDTNGYTALNIEDRPNDNIYSVSFDDDTQSLNINIIKQTGYPLPIFRYILKRID